MSEMLTYVYLNQEDKDIFVGYLWTRFHHGKESSSFKYADSWLKRDNCFEIDPFLVLSEGSFYTDERKSLFSCFSDCSPDHWGRLLIKRQEEYLSYVEGRSTRQLNQIDFMLAVDDFSRQGALRFKASPEGDFLFLNNKRKIPSLIKLSKLLMASEKIMDDDASYEDIKEILIPGTSLGGARPKASVIDDKNHLCIAKFPKKDDQHHVVLWEALALTLAQQAGLKVQEWKLINVLDKPVILLKRFDRQEKIRIPFISAMSMLNAHDGENHLFSYLDLAEVIRIKNVNIKEDMKELWSRIVFSILISNTDDHLRNHGFIKQSSFGWSLSPLYDVNPSADRTTHLQLNIDEKSAVASLDLAMSVANYFGFKKEEASATIKEIKSVVSTWKDVAKKLRIPYQEIERMKKAFKV